MCNELNRAMAALPERSASRRGLLMGAAAGVASAPLLTAAPATAATAAARGRRARTELVLLGTAGGPVFMSGERRGISTAVVHDGKVYVVDLGHGSPDRLVEAGLGGETLQSALVNVRGIFFTHLHSDHITEWPAVYLTATTNTENGKSGVPIIVAGPGDRGVLPRVYPEGRAAPPVVNPDDPTPGTKAMTGYLRQAFANDFNDRRRDSGYVDPDSLFDIRDIDISPYWTVDEAGVPPTLPKGTRIPVATDGQVRITGTLVDHHANAPAFGFRIDTPDGSVVISGDTAPSDNLIDLAHKADYLVHEVIDAAWVEEFTSTLPPEVGVPLREHLLAAHTTIEQVGEVANAAGVKNLVLTHLSPANIAPERFKPARRAFSGRLVVGEDLMRLPVGRRR